MHSGPEHAPGLQKLDKLCQKGGWQRGQSSLSARPNRNGRRLCGAVPHGRKNGALPWMRGLPD